MRFNVEITDELNKQLDTLVNVTGLSTKKDLFHNMVALFKWAVDRSANGMRVVAMDPVNRRIEEIALPALVNVRPVEWEDYDEEAVEEIEEVRKAIAQAAEELPLTPTRRAVLEKALARAEQAEEQQARVRLARTERNVRVRTA